MSTTKPLRRHDGLVIDTTLNKSVVPRAQVPRLARLLPILALSDGKPMFNKSVVPRAQVPRLARLLPILALSDGLHPNAYSLPRPIGYAC